MHLQSDELAALADGESTNARAEEATRHLAECSECAGRVERFERTHLYVAQLLQALDHGVPDVSADAVIARARRRPTRRRGALAAGIAALLIAGGAAATVPGSPMRRYVERVLAGDRSLVPQRPSVAARGGDRTVNGASGVAFVPVAGVDVVFRDAQSAGAILITLSDAAALRITHEGGSAGYALTGDGVFVENAASSASYHITLPRNVPRARVRVGDQVVFAKDGARIATAAVRDRSGAYVITFSQLSRRNP